MGKDTSIAWAHHTFNAWTGCSKVSPACTHCYAEAWAKRSGLVIWGEQGTRRRTSAANWKEPLKWNKAAGLNGVRERVFVNSLSDWAEDRDDLISVRADLFELIWECQNLDFLLLTKRPENIRQFLPSTSEHAGEFAALYWKNVWLGTTVENQEWADKRIPHLLQIPAAVHFISAEPLLGAIDLERYLYSFRLGWAIVGGESGAGFRPMNLDHARSLRDQCKAAGVSFFYKQNSAFRPGSDDLLDGVRHHEMPEVNK